MNQTYSTTLKTIPWQQRRLEIFQRDNWSCKCCKSTGSGVQLEVHHIDYFDDLKPWRYPDDMLISLCRECHQKETDLRPKHEKYLLQSLRSKGFLASDILCLSTLIDTSVYFLDYLKEVVRRAQQ